MRPFRFLRPASIQEAAADLRDAGDEGQAIAGGQSLLLAMKARHATPGRLVSLAHVPDLRGIRAGKAECVIGSMTTYAALEQVATRTDPTLRYVGAVVSDIADTAVRSMATIGGAACQAEPAFDVPALLTACDSTLTLTSVAGGRELAAEQFFLGAGVTGRREDEILCSVRIPSLQGAGCGFAKFGVRTHDAALASVAVVIRITDGVVRKARVVIGGCVERPTRAQESERWLLGQELRRALPAFGSVVAEEIEPTISTTPFSGAYRRLLLVGLARRALAQSAEA